MFVYIIHSPRVQQENSMIARGITKFYENTKDSATDATGSLLYRCCFPSRNTFSPQSTTVERAHCVTSLNNGWLLEMTKFPLLLR